MNTHTALILFVTIFSRHVQAGPVHRSIPNQEKDPRFWQQEAIKTLKEALGQKLNTNVAKNVILFVGDGMGVSTVTAARIFKGQLQKKLGEETVLEFEKFPYVGLSKTYNVDHQVPDSAATATAFLCGVKNNYGVVGLDARVDRGDCINHQDKKLTCIAELARKAGKRVGVVTTSRVTHATPAPMFSISPNRTWENDVDLPAQKAKDGCQDIASQMATSGVENLNVIFGGGWKYFFPESQTSPIRSTERGVRKDGKNIVQQWIDGKKHKGESASFVHSKRTLEDSVKNNPNNIIGLFETSHMHFAHERTPEEPTLPQMVTSAIKILSKKGDGFFLLVEAAQIDFGHHFNTARKALTETLEMEEAVAAALRMVNLEETLVIVTADHSHPMTISSYAKRGNPILGLTDYSDEINRTWLSNVDMKPYTTLSYANGPGNTRHRPKPKGNIPEDVRMVRKNLSGVDTMDYEYMQDTTVPLGVVSHDGTDVSIYANGPCAHLFHGTHEQHYIYHVMAYASCMVDIGDGHCPKPSVSSQSPQSYTTRMFILTFIISTLTCYLY